MRTTLTNMGMTVLAATLLAGRVAAGTGDPAPQSPLRLAVVDAGDNTNVPAALMDLLCLTLAQSKNVALLERQQIDRLLKEQRIGLSSEGVLPPEQAVKAGKIWATDAFLILEISRNTAGANLIRARLVDTWYGIKPMDLCFPLGTSGTYEALASSLVRKTLTSLAGVHQDPDQMRLVGVLPFTSIESSARRDYLKESLQAGTERQLSIMPGVLLVERDKTRPFSDERTLVAGLPQALQASAIVVDGEYEVKRGKEKTLVIYFRCIRNGKTIHSAQVEGPLADPATLTKDLAQVIVKKLGVESGVTAMDPKLEARMFMAYASVAETPVAADAAMEAAMALDPECDEHTMTFINSVMPRLQRGIDRDTASRRLAAVERLADRWANTKPFAYTGDRKEVISRFQSLLHPTGMTGKEQQEFVDEVGRPVFHRILSLLKASNIKAYAEFTYRSMVDSMLWPDAAAKHEAFRTCKTTLQKEDVKTQAAFLEFYLAQPEFWPQNPEAAMAELMNAVEIIDRAVLAPNMFASSSLMDSFFRDSRWSGRQDLGAIVLQAYSGLAGKTSLGLRITGELGLLFYRAKWATPSDHAQTRNQYERYEALFLKHMLSDFNFHFWILPALLGNDRCPITYYEDKQQDILFKAEHIKTVSYAILDRGLYGDPHWFLPDCDKALWLEKAGKPEQAEALIARICEASKTYKDGKWFSHHQQALFKLRARHPELTKAVAGKAIDCTALPVMSAKETPLLAEALRLVVEPDTAFIVCRKGIVHLDPTTLRALGSFDCVAKLDAQLTGHAVVENGTLYAQSAKGVVILPRDGQPWLCSEDNGFPTNTVCSLDVLNGKLYVSCGGRPRPPEGGPWDAESLIEFDPVTKQSRILLSTKARIKDLPLQGLLAIWHHVADPWHNGLLVSVYGDANRPDAAKSGAYLYSPGDDSVQRSDVSLGFECRRRHTELARINFNSVQFWDLKQQRELCAVSSETSGRMISRSAFCRIGRSMICSFEGSLEFFPAGGREPDIMNGTFFHDKTGSLPVHDMLMHEKGLLLLMDQTLYLVPGMNAYAAAREAMPLPRREAESGSQHPVPDMGQKREADDFWDDRLRGPKAAYDRFEEALKLPSGPNCDYPEAQKVFQEIYTKYPGTQIAEQARFEEVFRCVNTRNLEARRYLIDAFRKDFPDGPFISTLEGNMKLLEKGRLEDEEWQARDKARRSKQKADPVPVTGR